MINFLLILVSLSLWAVSFVPLYTESAPTRLAYLSRYSVYCQDIILLILSMVITFRAILNKGNLLITLFLIAISLRFPFRHIMLHIGGASGSIGLYIESVAIGTIFIKSMQSFPRQLVVNDVKSVLHKNKILRGYIIWSLKNYNWILFPLIIGLLQYFHNFSDPFILITALACLFINYKRSSPVDQNKILWLFWGLLMVTILAVFDVTVSFFNDENVLEIRRLASTVASAVVIISFAMSLFFSNAFDTGTIIKRTLVNSAIFFLIVIIYNTTEHYFLHWFSHKLHLSDVLVSSFLSGILVMVFSPLHHRFMHFMEKKIKKHDTSPK